MSEFIVNEDVKKVLGCINSGEKMIAVFGKAGTGKSSLIHYIRDNYEKRNIVVAAPTGISALNIGGNTVHSLFRIPHKVLTKGDVKWFKDDVIRKMDLLIMDEASMIRVDVLEFIDETLQLIRGNKSPFGGVQVIFFCDIFQLSPVVTKLERDEFYKAFSSSWFFTSSIFRRHVVKTVELNKIYRQQDVNFINLLNNIRNNEFINDTLNELNRTCFNDSDDTDEYVILCALTKNVELINSDKLGKLKTESKTYVGRVSGTFMKGYDKLPAPENLELKVGAKIMITKNIKESGLVNGNSGTVLHLFDDSIVVLINGKEYTLFRVVWECLKYTVKDGNVEPEVVGTYTQFPVMLGWALTIHKSQSLTLDKVCIDLGASPAFAFGLLYVGLSRCKTIEGLRLKRKLRISDVKLDETVVNFYKYVFKK